MRVTVRGVETDRNLLGIAEGLRVSARVHKASIRQHRDALKTVMIALAELEQLIQNQYGEAQGDEHGRNDQRH